MKLINSLHNSNYNALKEVILEFAKKIRKHTQSVYIRNELSRLDEYILEDIGMDEETLKRRKESGCGE